MYGSPNPRKRQLLEERIDDDDDDTSPGIDRHSQHVLENLWGPRHIDGIVFRGFRNLFELLTQAPVNFPDPITVVTGNTDAGHVRGVSVQKFASPSQIGTESSVPHTTPTFRGRQVAWGVGGEASKERLSQSNLPTRFPEDSH